MEGCPQPKRNCRTSSEKDLVALCIIAAEKAGLKRSVYLEHMESVGVLVPKTPASDWVASIAKTCSVESPVKESGRPAILDFSEERIVIGWLLHHNSIPQNVSSQAVQDFIRGELHKHLPLSALASLHP